MAIDTQTVLDCSDPHRTAKFWADALGYELEDNSALVRQVLDDGLAPKEATIEIDGRLAWRTAVAIRHPGDPVQEHTGFGLGRRMLFLTVPESKTVKNRMHLDLKVGPDRREAEVARLQELGATILARVDADGSYHVTMADLEGNEFCVQ